ncbi:MAG TPA: class I SAM-dependent methyltransferase [Candidatus Sulfotelmatobacter sp.]|jgi:cyclopropane fatty-acyl-phospholipid synthase-like methyltransferase|nr:class I SAM-dependent methyltransferase [Candidatus Sulfotelmatobacter sp.]
MLLKLGKSKELYLPVADRLSLNKSLELRVLSRYLELRPGERILDVACGSGYWTRKLAAAYGCTAVGIDLSEREIATAQRHHSGTNCTYLLSPAESLPVPTASFDKVISVCALEHFSSDTTALKEMARVLRPNGILGLSVDSMSGPFVTEGYREWHAQEHFVRNYYDLDSIRTKLEHAGFQLLEHRYLLTSRFTCWAFRLNRRYRFPVVFFIPLLHPLSRLCDALNGSHDGGLILALKAKKCERHTVGAVA